MHGRRGEHEPSAGARHRRADTATAGSAAAEANGADGNGADEIDGASPEISPSEQAEMFRSLVLSSPTGVVASDLAGRIVWVNPVAGQMFGRPPGDLLGRPFTVLLAEQALAEVFEIRRHILAGEDMPPFLTTAVRRDGSTFDLSVTPAARRDSTGAIVGTHIVLQDVTQQLRDQRELDEAVRRSHARFDQSSMPQAMLDLEGRFVTVNDAGCALLRRSRAELVGVAATDLIYPEDPERGFAQLRRLLSGTEHSATYQTVARLPDGGDLPLLVDISAVRDESGTTYEFAAFARDLSDLREAQRQMESQAAFFHALYRQSSDAAAVLDAEANIRYASPSVTDVLGYQPEDVMNILGFDFIHPDDVERGKEQLASVLAKPGRTERIVVRVRDADGNWRWFEDRLSNCLDDPDIRGLVVNLRDVSTEVEAQQALSESETRYRAIAQTAQEGIIAVSPEGEILFANERLGEILGRPLREIYAHGGTGIFEAASAARSAQLLAARGPDRPRRYDVAYHHPDGEERTLYVAASALVADDGTPLGSLAMVSDVTAERAAARKLRRQALHDTLTGLPNRALFMDRLATAAARHERGPGAGVALLFLDLDHFKLVNDTYGHSVGDLVLAEVGVRLAGVVRTTDTVARLGGDEFAVICEDTDEEDATLVAQRIQEALAVPVEVHGEQLPVSISIGVALAPPSPVADLLGYADTAMYHAKASGRSQVVTFTSSLSERTERRLVIAEGLRHALAQQSVPLVYAPVVDVATGRLLGLEASLHWQHPELGPVDAREVCTAAETSGLGYVLDETVARTAARELARLRAAGVVDEDVYVSVSVSPSTAQSTRLEGLVDAVLAGSGLPADRLGLELAERSLVEDPERAEAMMAGLNARGVRVTVGDFGSLYDSLTTLRGLPANALKIDRSFVEGIDRRDEAQGLAKTIVELAAAFRVRTVADGVTTEEQARTLQALGCHSGQGRLWGAGTPPDELDDLARSLRR